MVANVEMSVIIVDEIAWISSACVIIYKRIVNMKKIGQLELDIEDDEKNVSISEKIFGKYDASARDDGETKDMIAVQ